MPQVADLQGSLSNPHGCVPPAHPHPCIWPTPSPSGLTHCRKPSLSTPSATRLGPLGFRCSSAWSWLPPRLDSVLIASMGLNTCPTPTTQDVGAMVTPCHREGDQGGHRPKVTQPVQSRDSTPHILDRCLPTWSSHLARTCSPQCLLSWCQAQGEALYPQLLMTSPLYRWGH